MYFAEVLYSELNLEKITDKLNNIEPIIMYSYELKTNNSLPFLGGARGVMVIVAGYGHGDTSSDPGRDWLHFT